MGLLLIHVSVGPVTDDDVKRDAVNRNLVAH